MKKLIKLIVETKSSIPDLASQLNSIFGDAVAIQAFSIDDPAAYRFSGESAILASAISAADFPAVKEQHLQDHTVIPVNLVLQREHLGRLNDYPKGTQMLVVNVTKFMAEEAIAQLCQAGYGHLAYIPWYPGCSGPEIPLAVTPGEMALVPDFVTECIDLGPRLLDIMSIVELAKVLDCSHLLNTRRFFDHFERQYNPSAGISILVQENQQLTQRLSALTQMTEAPLISISANGQIFDCNFPAAELLNISRGQLLLRKPTFLPEDLLSSCETQQIPVSRQVTLPSGELCTAHLTPITRGAHYLGAYAVLTPIQQKNRPAPAAADRKGHVAKYRFSDICGSSAQIRQAVELAQKMARTESSILITGESGTGKELFAHAIHNNSPRADAPFVAINCAALADNLLESELFGYEEGAFTGARKGGKTGLFELANSGTIFLDEIEGMAPSTQLKLLRVIQEREIMRVGGDRVIPIDVRIISACNRDLTAMMREGKFRDDLFYRVSTLPLSLPPLRQRRQDILPLIEEFKDVLHLTFVLTAETRSLLLQYSWPGNIRELRNCVEYLGCQNLPVIEPENLPFTIRSFTPDVRPIQTELHSIQTELLRVLAVGSCGRKQLQLQLSRSGFAVTESQLRRELEQLKAAGWIDSGVGRGGSRLTETGLQELKNRL